MTRDTRWQFTLDNDRDKPPSRQVVRVKAKPSEGWGGPARVYLRTNADTWVREDQVEMDTTAAGIGVSMGVQRYWGQLLELEGTVWTEQRLVDADFDGLDADERRWTVVEAGGILGAAIADIHHHHCADGGWGDHSYTGLAEQLAELDEVMGKMAAAITATNERLRLLRTHAGRRANERWRADLAALDERIRAARHPAEDGVR